MADIDVIAPPTPAVLRVCDALDEAIGAYLEARSHLASGTYEADVEALLIFNLALRQVEAVTTLARRDLVLLPAAYSVARAALECGVRAAWLVDDADPFRREARWLAHMDGEISALRRAAERLEGAGEDVAARREQARTMQGFRDDIAAALSDRGVDLLKQTPNFAAMLSSIGGDHLYARYIEASQYTHGGHQATWLYRGGGLGVHKEIGERIVPEQWILPLRMCWLALGHPGEVVVRRIGGPRAGRWSEGYANLVDATFRDLASGRPDLLH